MCGDTSTFGIDHSGEPAGSGSTSNTTSAAPRVVPAGLDEGRSAPDVDDESVRPERTQHLGPDERGGGRRERHGEDEQVDVRGDRDQVVRAPDRSEVRVVARGATDQGDVDVEAGEGGGG